MIRGVSIGGARAIDPSSESTNRLKSNQRQKRTASSDEREFEELVQHGRYTPGRPPGSGSGGPEEGNLVNLAGQLSIATAYPFQVGRAGEDVNNTSEAMALAPGYSPDVAKEGALLIDPDCKSVLARIPDGIECRFLSGPLTGVEVVLLNQGARCNVAFKTTNKTQHRFLREICASLERRLSDVGGRPYEVSIGELNEKLDNE